MAKIGFSSAVVGFSGGADSVCLLHFLAQLPDLHLVAVHIHHGLRGEEADKDAQFCVDFCKRLAIPIEVISLDVASEAKARKISIEAAGRVLRYENFRRIKNEHDLEKIAIAHNRNDVAETVLMQLLRGTGRIKGIVAETADIARPLIDWTRTEIEDYCKLHKLSYQTDSTNFEDVFLRNKIRLNLMPELEKAYNPQIVDILTKFAKVSQDEDGMLETLAQEHPSKISDNLICIESLKTANIAIQRRIVRQVISDSNNIGFNHVEAVLDLMNKQSGKKINLPNGLIAARVYDKIEISRHSPIKALNISLPREKEVFVEEIGLWFYLGKNPKKKAFTKVLDCAKIGEVKVRKRLPGDKIGTKKVKDYFIDNKVPRQEREKAIFVASGSNVILIIGAVESDYFAPTNDNYIYLEIWEGNSDGIRYQGNDFKG